MIGLDTNVLLRYLTQDDPVQSKRATEILENDLSETRPGYVNHVVLCELVWVLEDCYSQAHADILKILDQLLKVAEIQFENPDVVRLAFSDYKTSGGDFSDRLISRSNLTRGCEHTLTFDEKAAKGAGFRSAV